MINWSYFVRIVILVAMLGTPLFILLALKIRSYLWFRKLRLTNVENYEIDKVKKQIWYRCIHDRNELFGCLILLTMFFGFVQLMLCASCVTNTVLEVQTVKNWNSIIIEQESNTNPTYEDCIKAESLNSDLDTFKIYKPDYLKTLPRINTWKMWNNFYKKVEQEAVKN